VDAVTSDGAVLVLDDGWVYSVDVGDRSTVSQWSSGDQVSVEDSNDAITNLSTGEKVSVTYVGESSDANSYADMGDHTQQTNSSDGSIVVLDDGCIWSVADADQATTSNWTDGDSITVNDSSDGSSSSELVNTDTQEIAEANYVGQE
jgi:hypothetical protein